jgi:steroid delta-isomerase-like uncharacterized protein
MRLSGTARRWTVGAGLCILAALIGYVWMDATTGAASAEHHEEERPAEVQVAKQVLHAFNESDWDTFGDLVTEDHVYVEYGTQRTIEGREALLEALVAWKATMPDVVAKPSAFLVGGKSVAIELTWVGTHTGPLMTPNGEIPASGNVQKTPGVWIIDVEDGKAVASRNYFDLTTLLQQIGAMPAGE